MAREVSKELLDLAYSALSHYKSPKFPSASFFICTDNLVMLPWAIPLVKVINAKTKN